MQTLLPDIVSALDKIKELKSKRKVKISHRGILNGCKAYLKKEKGKGFKIEISQAIKGSIEVGDELKFTIDAKDKLRVSSSYYKAHKTKVSEG